MKEKVKKTALHGWHTENGANMAQFGQYDMPLWYPTGAKKEHLAVLTNAGLFDTSHMSVVMVEGADSLQLLQQCFSKNLEACIGKGLTPLIPGRSIYGVFLNTGGEVIDDAIIFQIDHALYMVVVNAGMGDTISDHLKAHAGSLTIAVTDLTDAAGKLDVQGPLSAKILAKVIKEPHRVFGKMPYFSFMGYFDPSSPLSKGVELINGAPILLSRTGYTGEFGFEIFTRPEDFTHTWEMIFKAGKSFDLLPCGLAARDSLRAGAVLPLSHQDIGSWPFLNNPWPFALPYNDDKSGFSKPFIGADALLKTSYREYTLPFAGFDLRKVSTHDPSEVIDDEGRHIGTVLTCATDMAIGRSDNRIISIASPDTPETFAPRGLCCGFVKIDRLLSPGQTVRLRDKRREIKVEIVGDIRPARTARKALANFL